MKWMRMLGARRDTEASKEHHLKMIMKTRYPNRHRIKITSGTNCSMMLRVSLKNLGAGSTDTHKEEHGGTVRHSLLPPKPQMSISGFGFGFVWNAGPHPAYARMEKKERCFCTKGSERTRIWKVKTETKVRRTWTAEDLATASHADLVHSDTVKGRRIHSGGLAASLLRKSAMACDYPLFLYSLQVKNGLHLLRCLGANQKNTILGHMKTTRNSNFRFHK